MTDLTMSQFASKDDLIAAQAVRIAELESQLEAIGAGGVEPLRKCNKLHQIAEPAEQSATYGMHFGDRVLHIGGRENAAGYIEFGSVEAVRVLVGQVLRDLPGGAPGFELAATHPTQQGLEQAIEWPKARDVGRFGDMSPDAFIRVGLDADNDVYVSICDGNSVSDIEFCTPGGGGGRSSRTRMALIALMCAIEADNASHPSFDFWQRSIAAQAKQGAQAND